MKRSYKIQIIVIAFILFATLAGSMVLKFCATPATAELRLDKGETVSLKKFYFFDTFFKSIHSTYAKKGRDRSELGRWEDIRDNGEHWFFPNPGALLMLEISNRESKVVMQSAPVSGWGIDTVTRPLMQSLEPFEPSKVFSFSGGIPIRLFKGMNEIKVTVLKVDPSIEGENIRVTIDPPISVKSSQDHIFYNFLWYFFLIPYLSVPICFIWSGILFWLFYKSKS